MLFIHAIIIALLFLSITSCTMQKAINETGKEIDNGNYGVATWYVATLPIAMLYDVFTLGGTSDVETGYNTVSSVANKKTGFRSITFQYDHIIQCNSLIGFWQRFFHCCHLYENINHIAVKHQATNHFASEIISRSRSLSNS